LKFFRLFFEKSLKKGEKKFLFGFCFFERNSENSEIWTISIPKIHNQFFPPDGKEK